MGCTKSQENFQVVVLVGSLRKESTNRVIITHLTSLGSQAFHNVRLTIPDLGKLPIYRQDYSKLPPQSDSLRKIIQRCHGVIFATPQYNGCTSGIILNALSWLTDQKLGSSPLLGKKVGISSLSYLTERPIQDIKDICKQHKAQVTNHYYCKLQNNPVADGKIINEQQRKKIQNWAHNFIEQAYKSYQKVAKISA